ncbi:ComEA family DNA-binding protein [Pseudarthrobacter sulfonivorans]|uniref:ComEA family DNA-binding protein n=1 Tax=Pseudarthrobacter sulfonivorans TaxID=121292 RepID=UPI00285B49F3|nr:ComEA family DNA-binding protein [Pseudarthrobacter sulfonivorans]MDR6415900.1 competence protein ComEA [Pseudarthrobacter sulfonivorans]
MSRRDAGTRQGSRHARDRLQSTLGDGTGLLTDGGGKAFEYDGGSQVVSAGPVPKSDGADVAGTGGVGPALRWRVGLPVALLIAALAVVGGAWFWTQVAAGQPQVLPLSEVSDQESGPSVDGETPGQETDRAGPPEVPGESTQAGTVIIHVAGAVAVPGVVQLPAGSRVHQALAEAGGGTPSADLNRLNLAAVLVDGQKLYVPLPGEDVPADSGGGAAGAAAADPGGGSAAGGAKVNLNTAGVEELDALPKVGPVLAQRIVDWRKEHGLFKSVEELDAVDGVGPKMLETLLPLVGI